MKTVLLLIMLGVSVFATNTDSEYAEFIQIDKDEFGRTLLDSIQLQLEAKAPVDKLVKQLAYIENQLQADQRKSDSAHQAFQDKCDEQIKALEDDITRTKKLEADLVAEIAAKKATLAQKRAQKAAKEAEAKAARAEIARLIAERKRQAHEFDRKVKEHEYATFVINEAKKIFDKTFKGRSFLETSSEYESAFVQVSEHFTQYANSDNFKIRRSYGSLFKVLASITSSKKLRAKGGMVGRVYKLFDEILEKIEDSLTNERKTEEGLIRLFRKNKAQKEKELAKLLREIASLNVEIIALVNRIREATRELAEARQRIVLKTRELNDKIRECDDEAEAYKNDRVKRDVKKNIVSQLIGLIQSKLRKIRSYVKSRKH